jgi:hypothetical protein
MRVGKLIPVWPRRRLNTHHFNLQNIMEKHRISDIDVNNVSFTFQHIPSFEGYKNTQVRINGKEVIWINWDDRVGFVNEFRSLLNKYDIRPPELIIVPKKETSAEIQEVTAGS